MSDILTASRAELIKLVYDLIDENQALQMQIAELKARLDQPSDKPPQTPPAFVKANTPKKHKQPRSKRDRGYARKLDVPTKQVFHTLDCCPDCGGSLGKPSVAYTRQVIDIPQVIVEVTEHVVMKRLCTSCRRRVLPNVDLSTVTMGQHRVSMQTMSVIAALREQCRLPIGVIKGLLETLYGLKLSKGELVAILATIATHGKPTYDRLQEEIRSSPVVHADETGWREDGKNSYLWNFSTPRYQYLLYRKSRAGKVVAEVLGEDGHNFAGVLVTDFYAAYNIHTGFHQRCLVHLLRDIHELKKRHTKHPPVNKWAKQVKQVINEAKAWPGPDPTLPAGTAAQLRIQKQHEFEEQLKAICEPYVVKDVPMSTLCSRVVAFLPELFTFVRYGGVASDNNPAERALRHSVVQRKVFGGTRSPKGSQTKAILGSLFGTWQLQGLNPLHQTRQLLTAAACQ